MQTDAASSALPKRQGGAETVIYSGNQRLQHRAALPDLQRQFQSVFAEHFDESLCAFLTHPGAARITPSIGVIVDNQPRQ